MDNQDTQQKDQEPKCCSDESFGALFEICVKGQLDSSWSDWLEGMEVKLLNNDQTMLCGHIIDQAALMGILNKLCGLNLTLQSVREVTESEKNQNVTDKEQ